MWTQKAENTWIIGKTPGVQSNLSHSLPTATFKNRGERVVSSGTDTVSRLKHFMKIISQLEVTIKSAMNPALRFSSLILLCLSLCHRVCVCGNHSSDELIGGKLGSFCHH